MTMRALDQLEVIQQVVDGNLKASTAAKRSQLTQRQVNRLVQRYRSKGPAGLISRQRSQPGHRQLDNGMAEIALTIIRDRMRISGRRWLAGNCGKHTAFRWPRKQCASL